MHTQRVRGRKREEKKEKKEEKNRDKCMLLEVVWNDRVHGTLNPFCWFI